MPFYLTTPIYYVNGAPHLGHVYTTVAADVVARHMRQRGEDVFFLTGTDEHGEPVSLAAEREGIPPRDLADRNAERFKQVAARINATNDFFIRTSDPEHTAVVSEVVTRLKDNGHVYEGTYEGWYCPRCADFKTDSELLDGDRCPIHLIELEREQEDNWFFRLSTFQEPLEQLYAENPEWVLPGSRYNEALSFIKGGLQDLSLSRARISWGVPVPWDPDQVIYVWIDALLNYYSALSYAREGEDLTEKFWPADVHLIAKDILKFHAVFWPALLMAADLPVPARLYVHGYLLMDDHKMSKSLGNVLDPFKVMDIYGTDALRYYLLREVSFGQDGSISPEGFESRYNTELANDYGNLASRTLAMIKRYRDGVVPESEPAAGLVDEFGDLTTTVCARLDRIEVSAALDEIWTRVRLLNRYVQDSEPWKLAKDPQSAGDLDVILYGLAEGLRVVSLLLLPYLPETADRLLAALGQEERSIEAARFGASRGGARIGDLGQLFPKIESPEATAA
ncbi:MAG: methionine--tRNA ligase [Thermoleophilaceae bacterium]